MLDLFCRPYELPPISGPISFWCFSSHEAAYVLVQAMRRTGASRGRSLARAHVGTLQLRTLFKVAGASVCVSPRRVVFHLASSYFPTARCFDRCTRAAGERLEPSLGHGSGREQAFRKSRGFLVASARG